MKPRLLAGAALLAWAAPLAAQSTGAIAGVVTDAQTGRGLANVTVTVEGGRRGAVSDSAGRYRIREVRSGTYTLRAVLIGYTPAQREDLVAQASGTLVVNVAMAPTSFTGAPPPGCGTGKVLFDDAFATHDANWGMKDSQFAVAGGEACAHDLSHLKPRDLAPKKRVTRSKDGAVRLLEVVGGPLHAARAHNGVRHA